MRLTQVLHNLVQNTLNHTPPGGTVTLTADQPTRSTLRLVVLDMGRGRDAEQLARVFDRLYRADDSRAAPGVGTTATIALPLSLWRHSMTPSLTDLLSPNVTYRVESTAHRDILHVTFSPEDTVRALLSSGLDDLSFDDHAVVIAQRLGEAEAARRHLRDPAIDISDRYGDALDEVSPRPDNDEEMYQRLDRAYPMRPD